MNDPFALTTPCAECPFRRDIKAYLRPGRVRQIERSLVQDQFFCHKLAEERVNCAGSLILLEKLEQPSNAMRMAERLGLYKRDKLNMAAPVFESFDEMEAAQVTEHDQSRHKSKR